MQSSCQSLQYEQGQQVKFKRKSQRSSNLSSKQDTINEGFDDFDIIADSNINRKKKNKPKAPENLFE